MSTQSYFTNFAINFVWMTVATYLVVSYAKAFYILRFQTKVEAGPHLRPTLDEDITPAVRKSMAEMIPKFAQLGFEIVANAHLPLLMPGMRVTQILFVNRADQVRAALMYHIRRRGVILQLVFVTEFADGEAIKTTRSPNPPSTADANEHWRCRPDVAIPEGLYQAHRQHVAEIAPHRTDATLPPTGREMEYIASRHAESMKRSMTAQRWRLDPTGTFYRMPTHRAALNAFRYVFRPITQLFRQNKQPKMTAEE